MKIRLSLLPGLLLLAGCQAAAPIQPSPAISTLAPGCTTPGTLDLLSLGQTSGGIAYHYAVYLPPCYETQTDGIYPVLYLVPGRTSGPSTWFNAGTADIADELILSGEIPPFIIVSTQDIDNDMFAETITNELIPFIETNYRISPERRYHAVAGGSLGGIAAYRIGFRDPNHFASVGMFGSGAIHGEEPQIQTWLAAMTPGNKPRVFLNSGFGDPLMVDRARVMTQLLDEVGIAHTEIFSDGAHNYAYWATNLPAYFRWMAQDW